MFGSRARRNLETGFGRNRNATKILLTGLIAMATLAAASPAMAKNNQHNTVEVVALDECDPTSFNAVLGADFCVNIGAASLGGATDLATLLSDAQKGTPSPDWDFEPDKLTIKKGTTLVVVNQGGEPHTFTEVKQFGDGFAPALNPNKADDPIPECKGGFSNLKVARTRIHSGSELIISGLSKGVHYFQCCIHPWMRMEVDVR